MGQEGDKELEELREALNRADKELDALLVKKPDEPKTSDAYRDFGRLLHHASLLYGAKVMRDAAFTRYMEASHRRSDERAEESRKAAEARAQEAHDREGRAEQRAKEAAIREAGRDAIARRETAWIKWATIVIAVATVAYTVSTIWTALR